jgi:hypothetical protein
LAPLWYVFPKLYQSGDNAPHSKEVREFANVCVV